MNLKTIIIYNKDINPESIIKNFNNNTDLYVSKLFTNNSLYEEHESSDKYYINNINIQMSFKNNAVFMYKKNTDEYIEGITIDEFYKSDILYMQLCDFNNISTNFLNNNAENLLIVWLDNSSHSNINDLTNDINEVNYLLDKLKTLKYLYFLDESDDVIVDNIIKYLNSSEDIRQELLENFS